MAALGGRDCAPPTPWRSAALIDSWRTTADGAGSKTALGAALHARSLRSSLTRGCTRCFFVGEELETRIFPWLPLPAGPRATYTPTFHLLSAGVTSGTRSSSYGQGGGSAAVSRTALSRVTSSLTPLRDRFVRSVIAARRNALLLPPRTPSTTRYPTAFPHSSRGESSVNTN